jgi:hypothetical protein
MVAALPEATTSTPTPQQEFSNVYGNMVDAEQALEITAQEYMASEYITGGDRMESIVTPLLIARWQQVHDDMIGDIAWIAIFRGDRKEHGECKPRLTMTDPDERNRHLDDAYRRLVLHLEITGLITLLEAQEGRAVRQAGIAIQSKLTEHIRVTDHQRRRRRAKEYYRRDGHRSHIVIQLSDPAEYISTGVAGRGSLDEEGMAYWSRTEADQRVRTIILRDVWLIDNDHREDEGKRTPARQGPAKAHPTPHQRQSRTADPRGPSVLATATTAAMARVRRAVRRDLWWRLTISDTIGRRRARRRRSPRPRRNFPPSERRHHR